MALSIDDIKSMAEAQGWKVSRTANSHWRFVAPTGEIIFAAGTPSDRRAMQNHITRMRRAGFVDDEDRIQKDRTWARSAFANIFSKDKLHLKSELHDIQVWARSESDEKNPALIATSYGVYTRKIEDAGEEFLRSVRRPMSENAYRNAKAKFIDVVEDAASRLDGLSKVLLSEPTYEIIGHMLLESGNRLRTLVGRLRSES